MLKHLGEINSQHAYLSTCHAGVEVIHGVDATQLPRGLGGLTDWSQVQHIIWNFPLLNPLCHDRNSSSSNVAAAAAGGGGGVGDVKFLGDDEEVNRKLLGDAFAAMSRVVMARNGAMRVSQGPVWGGGLSLSCMLFALYVRCQPVTNPPFVT